MIARSFSDFKKNVRPTVPTLHVVRLGNAGVLRHTRDGPAPVHQLMDDDDSSRRRTVDRGQCCANGEERCPAVMTRQPQPGVDILKHRCKKSGTRLALAKM